MCTEAGLIVEHVSPFRLLVNCLANFTLLEKNVGEPFAREPVRFNKNASCKGFRYCYAVL